MRASAERHWLFGGSCPYPVGVTQRKMGPGMEVTLWVINLGTWCDTHGDFLSLKLL